jgi:hypothetical protein
MGFVRREGWYGRRAIEERAWRRAHFEKPPEGGLKSAGKQAWTALTIRNYALSLRAIPGRGERARNIKQGNIKGA